jgi:hypothetical protein
MEVRDVRIEDSPLAPGRARLRADVRYETGNVASEEYWFDVPATYAAELATSGNPWLACLLPLVAHTGERLRLPLPVDRALLANAERLMRIWQAWYPDVTVAPVEAEPAEQAADGRAVRAASFFSGGVDSFFTVLRCRDVAPPAERTPVDDLITVWGFDVPLERPDAFTRLRHRHEAVARELGKQFIDVATNLRSTRWSAAQWSYLAHGAALAGVALSLERRFHTVYLAGSGSYRDVRPWGSHPITDPLFSTRRTSIVFDAGAYLRTDKIEHVATSATALRALHVCFETASDENCGVCGKCQRTMLALELFGALERCTTFPSTRIDLRRLARMDCSHRVSLREVQDLRKLALAKRRADVVRALDRAVARTARRRRVRAGIEAVRRPVGALIHRLRGDP